MSAWATARLASIAEVRLGRQRSPKNHDGDQMRSYLRAANVGWDGLRLDDVKTMQFTDAEMDTYRLQSGDLLLSEASGSPKEVGKPAIWRGELRDCAFQNTLIRVRPGPDACPEYLLQYFRYLAMTGRFVDASRGVGIHHLGREALASWQVPLPPLDEQRRIAEVLDRADALRAKRRESIALLHDLTQSIFHDMFGDPSAAWPSVTVEEALDRASGGIRTGPFGSQLLHSEFVDSGIAVLGIDNVVGDEFRWGERRYITEDKYAQLKRFTVRPGDVLITIMGTCGRVAIVPEDTPTAINTKHLCCMTLNRERCLPEYLRAYFLWHPGARAYLERTAKGAIMSGLNMGIVRAMPLMLPPISIQTRFSERLRTVQDRADHAKHQRAQLDLLFASLQERAFSGQL